MIVWNNTLVDGHNRYAILQKHPEIYFSTMPLRFENREEAIAWICRNQLGRRNLSPEQKRYLLGKQYEAEKKAAKIFRGNQYTLAKKSGGAHDDNHHSGKKTCDRIAEENGVSRASVLRASHYTRGIDIADNLSPGIKQKVFSGEVKFTNEEMSKLVQASVEHRSDVLAQILHPEALEVRSIKPNLISAANAVTLAKLQLKVLMGITADVEIKINDNLTNYETTMFANQLKEENVNLNNNTTMKQLDLNMKLLEKNVKSLKTNFMPTVSMSFSYQYQSLYNPNINFFNYNWSNSSSLMFNISIPLYKASNFTKVKSARIQMRQLDWNRIDTERQLNIQIVSCRNNMSASTEQVVSNKENVMQAKKAVVIAEKRYDVGKGTVLELNSSQVSLTQAQLTYNQSIYDYLVAKADLDQVLGKE